MILTFLAFVAIAGCDEGGRPFDQVQGQAPVYLDEVDPQARDATIKELSQAIEQGTRAHPLQPGDVVTVLFFRERLGTVRDYRIGVGDEIEVSFDFQPQMSRTYTVRPDGRIALAQRGEIIVTSRRPADVAREISRRYADLYVDPSVTVNVRRFTSDTDSFLAMIAGATGAHAEHVTIAPDGTVTLPMLRPVRIAGRTVDDLAVILNHDYAERLGNVTTTTRLASVASQQVFVFGEVQRPGPIPSTRARSVVQLIAAAGGPNEFAAMSAVRVLYWDEVGQPRIRQINVMDVLQKFKLDQDLVVPANAVVYVPPTTLAKAGRLVDQVIRRLFLFQGVNVGFQYGATLRQ